MNIFQCGDSVAMKQTEFQSILKEADFLTNHYVSQGQSMAFSSSSLLWQWAQVALTGTAFLGGSF